MSTFFFFRGIKAKSHMTSHFSSLTCKSCSYVVFFLFFCPVFSTVLPAKTQGPSRTLRQEGCLCPLGSSQSCCCPTVRPPDRRTEGERSDAAADRRTLRNTHGWCVRRVYAPLTEAFPVESLEPPEGQKQVAMATV